ncbi:Hypothetical_protein [Hexamita inflata]|uniref:Hypothetical_protein n=1 Tax=Hexamita inflata TaxID=28002 RepID=A0ABP1HZ99_9EUKA
MNFLIVAFKIDLDRIFIPQSSSVHTHIIYPQTKIIKQILTLNILIKQLSVQTSAPLFLTLFSIGSPPTLFGSVFPLLLFTFARVTVLFSSNSSIFSIWKTVYFAQKQLR